ncbi:MAG TPA: DUF4019 domain-containing protein [Pyrinomonadaceae bacterium]|nr:DUF4019 domain-containing protein [Pyrinomonadaceae bacterium]
MIAAKSARDLSGPIRSFEILRILALSVSISFVGLACGLQSERRTVPPEVESAIGTLGEDISAERYEKIYREASDLWRQDSTLEQSVTAFRTLREKLGPFESRVLQSATEQTNASGPLQGRAYILSYRTKFQNGEGMETFTLVDRKGQWLLARYLVTSTVLR